MKIEIIEQSSEPPSAEERALAIAVREAREHNCQVTVVVPAKKHANSTPLKYLLCEHEVDALLKGKFVQIAENVVGRLVSNATLKTETHDQVLLVIRGWSEAISKVKNVSGVCSLIVVSPSSEETNKWLEAFGEEQT